MSGKRLSAHFTEDEFRCRCGCAAVKVDPALIELLEAIRSVVDLPIQITSGYRCPAHNAAVSGTIDSAHTRGKAADFFVSGSIDRYRFLDAAFFCGARRIGIGADFIHVDVDESLAQEVVWLYGGKA